MTDEPARWSEAPTLRNALNYVLACGCTISDACPHHQQRIDDAEYEREYGSSDEWCWDPDR